MAHHSTWLHLFSTSRGQDEASPIYYTPNQNYFPPNQHLSDGGGYYSIEDNAYSPMTGNNRIDTDFPSALSVRPEIAPGTASGAAFGTVSRTANVTASEEVALDAGSASNNGIAFDRGPMGENGNSIDAFNS